ncbi:hypothetical protein [Acinetobacter sp. PW68]|uniref:hypothetical protein n=1 Tax=Acinetobacter sp. PW68 TaxID=2865162 RepID=UPI001E3F9624|nr:hypothetical protein [Acinetobacter sp. PW68]MCD0186975.1 hypothetical protein [Acinetobacter sp. PW68]
MSFIIKKNELGQFDTPVQIATSVMSNISYNYDFFVDLGAGLGNLSSLFHGEKGIMVELDEDRYSYLKSSKNRNISVINKDVLSEDLFLKEMVGESSVLFLSNPPFNRKNTGYEFKYFYSLNNGSFFHQLDIAFLDKTLASKTSTSSIVFIVSAPFVESEKYAMERDKFVKEFQSLEIISLDIRTFTSAEVQSYVLIAHPFSGSLSKKILLKKMNLKGDIIDEISIDESLAKNSLSYLYHKEIQDIRLTVGKGCKILKDFDVSLVRGSQTRKYFDDLGKKFIHTTDLVDQFLYLDNEFKTDNLYSYAESNDILISRVGRRSLARESLVKEGGNIFTESIFRLKTKSQDNQLIWNSISSDIGKKWRELHAQGKCAKYLTRNAILNIPIL